MQYAHLFREKIAAGIIELVAARVSALHLGECDTVFPNIVITEGALRTHSGIGFGDNLGR